MIIPSLIQSEHFNKTIFWSIYLYSDNFETCSNPLQTFTANQNQETERPWVPAEMPTNNEHGGANESNAPSMVLSFWIYF